jgi:hypothetical protein
MELPTTIWGFAAFYVDIGFLFTDKHRAKISELSFYNNKQTKKQNKIRGP